VKDFKTLVDKHGFPVFFKALFPGVKMPDLKQAAPAEDANDKNETEKKKQ
jgi:hypothetical protein